MTFCPAYGIILEQSARTTEEQKVNIAGWSSLVARRAHNPKVVGSNPAPATTKQIEFLEFDLLFLCFDIIQIEPRAELAVPGGLAAIRDLTHGDIGKGVHDAHYTGGNAQHVGAIIRTFWQRTSFSVIL